MRPKKVQKIRLTSHLKIENYHRLCEKAEAAECSRSDVIDELLERGSLLEAIRKIVREEIDSKRL
jgi:hypothetical protein